MFITRYPLVVCSLISQLIKNNAKIKIKIKKVLQETVQKRNLNTNINKRSKTEKSCTFNQIKRGKTNILSSDNYNELLQICVLHLSTYHNPLYLLQFLVTKTGLSNSTTLFD